MLYTTGDRDGEIDRRVTTPMGLFGASGYWGYTHIFTANGPSDVNDLGLEIGNGGAGLFTTQVLGRVLFTERLGLATAKLGDFFGRDADRIHEFFCRLQLQY